MGEEKTGEEIEDNRKLQTGGYLWSGERNR
jgi:hypothetical protein